MSIVQKVQAELNTRLQHADISSVGLDYADVSLGLLARQFKLWSVAVLGPSSWTQPTSPLILRALADGLITVSWLSQNQASAARYKAYSAGRLKLLAAHWRALEGSEADSLREEYADNLEELASSEVWSAILPVELGNWNSKDIRTMAIEAGLKSLYDLTYSPLSAEAHGEWMALRKKYLRLCEDSLHRTHWLPLFELPSYDSRTPIAATQFLILAAGRVCETLSVGHDDDFWSSVINQVVSVCGDIEAGDESDSAAPE